MLDMTDGIWLRFLSGPEIDSLGLTRQEIVDAVEAAVRDHGEGETSFEPRVHLMPDNGGIGHFNVLRGHLNRLGEHGISGVKVVGDFVPNYQVGLPSELAMATLFDPTTGVPLAVLDATMITAARTGAMTTWRGGTARCSRMPALAAPRGGTSPCSTTSSTWTRSG
jgi:ornithine cyclodeaminase